MEPGRTSAVDYLKVPCTRHVLHLDHHLHLHYTLGDFGYAGVPFLTLQRSIAKSINPEGLWCTFFPSWHNRRCALVKQAWGDGIFHVPRLASLYGGLLGSGIFIGAGGILRKLLFNNRLSPCQPLYWMSFP